METQRPNVVMLLADDLGWGDLGCFGSETIPTPNIDSIAEGGVKFTEWYSNSPVCSPSRASLMTGRYPERAGVETILGGTRHTAGLPHQDTIASLLRERQYRTGIFGKWHLGAAEEYSPLHFGFDQSFGFRAGCLDYYSHIFYWGEHNPIHDLWDDDHEVWRNGQYLTTMIGRHAAEFISSAPEDESFFCYVPFNAPHYPMHAPEEYFRRVGDLPPGERETAAMISAMDDAIGDVLDALNRTGRRENTIVIFSSDNGASRESRNWLDGEEVSYTGGSVGGLRGSKGSVFEGGVRVPCVMSWPAVIPAGTTVEEPSAMMDVAPTLLEAIDGNLAGCQNLDGASLLQTISAPRSRSDAQCGADDEVPSGRSIHWTYEGQWAIRLGRYKYIERGHEGMDPIVAAEDALFDLVSDVAEQHDISATHPNVVRHMKELLAQHKEESARAVR